MAARAERRHIQNPGSRKRRRDSRMTPGPCADLGMCLVMRVSGIRVFRLSPFCFTAVITVEGIIFLSNPMFQHFSVFRAEYSHAALMPGNMFR